MTLEQFMEREGLLFLESDRGTYAALTFDHFWRRDCHCVFLADAVESDAGHDDMQAWLYQQGYDAPWLRHTKAERFVRVSRRNYRGDPYAIQNRGSVWIFTDHKAAIHFKLRFA